MAYNRLLSSVFEMFEMAVIAILLALWLGEIGERNRYELTDVTVHDGDTITATINLGWKIMLVKEHVRASNYDAWEITKTRKTVGPISDDEIEKGKKAKAFVEECARGARLYVVPSASGQRDVYGRVLGEIWLSRGNEWIALADVMREKGFVRIKEPPP